MASLIRLLETMGYARPDAELVGAIARGGTEVARLLRSGERKNRSSERNVHGETIHDLDRASTDLFGDLLARSRACAGLLAEETPEPLDFSSDGERFVFLDPLDGSANLDSHGPTGSIFGIVPSAGSSERSALAPGRSLTAAGYLLYSSATLLVVATRARVDLFVFDAGLGQFVLRDTALTTPKHGFVYSVNEANVPRWRSHDREFLARLKSGEVSGGRPYSQRYAGALVADAHRTLVQGGFFAYPADISAAKGKLRLQYEVNPMAFVFRAAGARATTGSGSPLEVIPESGHERSPLILGSVEEIDGYERWTGTGERASARVPSYE